ncbi:PT domain-containing protein [Dolichospermum sp. ST_sed1]|nr:PT domain-containing protein [Dolichospermum sp. ST_sed1]
MLLIYWLRTKERSFQYGRPVYNSLALVSEDEKDNLLLQMLASEALKDWEKFAEKLDSFVKWDQDNEHGFKVEESQLLEYIQNQKSKNLDNADKTRKLACDVLNKHSKSPEKKEIFQKTAQKWIKELAGELETTQLPSGIELLVVVAENIAEDVLEPVVWRGISDRVESEGWKECKKKYPTTYPTTYMILAIVFIIGSVLLVVIFLFSQPQKNPTPQPSPQTEIQPSPIPTTIPQAEIQTESNPEIQETPKT